MINIDKVKLYCSDDITKIENYEEASNDENLMWHCHHRLESDFTKEELLSRNMYYNIPAYQLIFLTPKQHLSIHFNSCAGADERKNKISSKLVGNINGSYGSGFTGRHHTIEARRKIGEASIGRQSRLLKKVWEKKDEILELLNSGVSIRKISEMFNCSNTVIRNIRKKYQK